MVTFIKVNLRLVRKKDSELTNLKTEMFMLAIIVTRYLKVTESLFLQMEFHFRGCGKITRCKELFSSELLAEKNSWNFTKTMNS